MGRFAPGFVVRVGETRFLVSPKTPIPRGVEARCRGRPRPGGVASANFSSLAALGLHVGLGLRVVLGLRAVLGPRAVLAPGWARSRWSLRPPQGMFVRLLYHVSL